MSMMDPNSSPFTPRTPEDNLKAATKAMTKLGFSRSSTNSSQGKTKSQMSEYGAIGEELENKGSKHNSQRSPTPSSTSHPSGRVAFTPLSTNTNHPSKTIPTPTTAKYSTPDLAPRPSDHHVAGFEVDKGQSEIFTNFQSETPETIGRFVMISQVPKDLDLQRLKVVLGAIAEFKAIVVKHLRTKSCIFVTFYDPREAFKLYEWLRVHTIDLGMGRGTDLQCLKVDRGVVEQATGPGAEYQHVWSDSEGSVLIEFLDCEKVELGNLETLLKELGDIMWTQELGLGRKFLVEFWDTRQASQAVAYLNGQHIRGAHIVASIRQTGAHPQPETITSHRPTTRDRADFTLGSAAYIPGSLGPRTLGQPKVQSPYTPVPNDIYASPAATGYSDTPSTRLNTPNTPMSGHWRGPDHFHTPSSVKHQSMPHAPWNVRVTPGFPDPSAGPFMPRRLSEPGAYQGPQQSPAAVGTGYGSPKPNGSAFWGTWDGYEKKKIPEQNVVRLDKIMSGLEPRTTVMIKDVPNKLSRDQLVAILNSVVPGGFDFVYLRFDFKNCCNVGYAFVNFTSVRALYDFYKGKVGQRWNMFSSEKVLQICYADIQGKQALINKFRNSAVMEVIEQWRPQIFYSSGTKQGLLEPFPEPDNLAQRQRSTTARLSSLSGGTQPMDWYPYDCTPTAFAQGF